LSRCPTKFRKIDVQRAVRAVQSTGLDIARIEIDINGKIVVVTTTSTTPGDEIDKELEAFEAQHGNHRNR
jgi:hypothetical protein